MNSIELIQKITNGEIDNCKILVKQPYETGIIEIKDKGLLWEPGKFSTKFLTDGYTEFEVLDGNIENMQEIQKSKELEKKADRIINDLINNEDMLLNNLRAERKELDGKQQGYQEAMFKARIIITNHLKEDKQ